MAETAEEQAAREAAEKKDQPEPKKTETDFQAEAAKWKALSQKMEARAKENADAAKRLAELEEADKTEIQRAVDKATEAERRATEAEAKALRIEVALDKAPDGMPLTQVRKLAKRLTGSTQEELEADAVELFEDFAPPAGEEDPDKQKDSQRRPKERLRPGAVPDAEPDESDPAKLAESVSRGW